MNMNSTFNIALEAMPAGMPARIQEITAAPTDRDRLEVLGLCEGRIVEVVRSGDPMIVRLLGTRIGLAAALARTIRVEAEPGVRR